MAGSFKAGAAPTVAVPKATVQRMPPLVYTEGSSLPPPPPRGGPSTFDPGEGADNDEGTIPDADTIRRAKQRRERLRTGGRASDFIGLSDEGPRFVDLVGDLVSMLSWTACWLRTTFHYFFGATAWRTERRCKEPLMLTRLGGSHLGWA